MKNTSIKKQIMELENPFNPQRSGLEQSAYNGFEVARLKILQMVCVQSSERAVEADWVPFDGSAGEIQVHDCALSPEEAWDNYEKAGNPDNGNRR